MSQIRFRTIIRDVPQAVVDHTNYRMYNYDSRGVARYNQPKVFMMVDLQVVSPETYKEKTRSAEMWILHENNGKEAIYQLASSTAKSKAEKATYHHITNRLIENTLIDKELDVTINNVWEKLPTALKGDIHNHTRVKRRYLLELMDENNPIYDNNQKAHARNYDIIIQAFTDVFFEHQMNKIPLKAKREVALKYISADDPRLYNKEFKLVETDDEVKILGNHVFLADDMINKIKHYHQLNLTKLTAIRSEYSEDYFHLETQARKYYHWSPELLADDKDALISKLEIQREMEVLVAKQSTFHRPNTWQLSCPDLFKEENDYKSPIDMFKHEYDYIQFDGMLEGKNKGIVDLDYVLNHADDFIGINNKSPFYIWDETMDSPPKPTPVLELDFNAFNPTYKQKITSEIAEKLMNN